MNFWKAARNQRRRRIVGHEMAHEARGEVPKFPPQADIGYRAVNALTAHDTDVVIPADAPDQVQYRHLATELATRLLSLRG